MKIENEGNMPFNYPANLKPLFDAMKAGKTIKRVVCYGGEAYKDQPWKDFTIRNFKATEYTVGMSSKENKHFDFVDTDATETRKGKQSPTVGFYMNWVKVFDIE